jgi:alpha-L-fucosidase
LIHEQDVASVLGLRALIDAAYGEGTDAARGRKTTATNSRGDSMSSANVVDGDATTYWATEDAVRSASVEIELDATKAFDRVVLAEPIALGQRIAKFRVSVLANGDAAAREWITIAEGSTVGHKRIVRVPETKAKRVRIEILESRACPMLTHVGVHHTRVLP